jgi:hypothetical protein
LLVAITSKGDLATKYLLPIANMIDLESAAGHLAFLHSHMARQITCPSFAAPDIEREQAKTTEPMINEAVQSAVDTALRLSRRHQPVVGPFRERVQVAKRRDLVGDAISYKACPQFFLCAPRATLVRTVEVRHLVPDGLRPRTKFTDTQCVGAHRAGRLSPTGTGRTGRS